MDLQSLMVKCHVNQAQLANQVGVSQQLVSRWINKKSIPKPNAILKLANLLHTDTTSILECFND